MSKQEQITPLVIASGDEGLQINNGVRFAFVGSGYQLPGFAEALAVLRKTVTQPLVLASMQEDDWLSEKLQSKNPNLYQETLKAWAEENQLSYVGQFDYGDPRDLDDGVTRGHIVRPPKIHVADQICFTLGGGEQTFNLRQVVISADYVYGLQLEQVKQIIGQQVDFYQQLLGKKLKAQIDDSGPLPDELKKRNQNALAQVLSQL